MQDHELDDVRHEVQRVLQAEVSAERHEALIDQAGGFDRALWQVAVGQGWPAAGLSEDHGGSGLGWAGLALLAEESGRQVAALPLSAGAVAAEALSASADLFERYGAALRDGEAIACLAFGETGQGDLSAPSGLRLDAAQRLTGAVPAVAFGAVADLALVSAQHADGRAQLVLVPLATPAVQRTVLNSYDNPRGYADLRFDNAEAMPLQREASFALAAAAVLQAFEQIGGAQAVLAAAIEHALQREAFGQPIARFQGVKHKLTEIYGLVQIARGCALAALQSLDEPAGNEDDGIAPLLEAAAAARLAACKAYEQATRDGINVFGALGLTREAVLHRHYRRARSLALELGSTLLWREALVDAIAQQAGIGSQA